MNELDKILDTNEKVLWQGKPYFWSFFLGRSLGALLFGVIWTLIIMATVAPVIASSGNIAFIFVLPHFWVGFGLIVFTPIYSALVCRFTHYAITDKRALFQEGLIGRDFKTIDFDQLTNSEVLVGVIDKIFGGTGSIRLFTAGTFETAKNRMNPKPYTIAHIHNPYEVFKFIKKVSHDVRTDVNYPNELRPRQNPGFQTEYSNETFSSK